MTTRRSFLGSLITTKLIIGVTGILLFLYLILHIAGNLMVFLGPENFNTYSHALISNPLVVPVEIGLLVVFLIHLFKADQDDVPESVGEAREIREEGRGPAAPARKASRLRR